MTKPLIALLFTSLFVSLSAQAASPPANPSDGQLFESAEGWRAWSAPQGAWLEVETFWTDYADRASGKNWGRGSDYPPYRETNEHDTFLVEVGQGSCLMYFFHGRWRRAQDVRRWDPVHNELLGCPYVFD